MYQAIRDLEKRMGPIIIGDEGPNNSSKHLQSIL